MAGRRGGLLHLDRKGREDTVRSAVGGGRERECSYGRGRRDE
jgi:hypothetical protein